MPLSLKFRIVALSRKSPSRFLCHEKYTPATQGNKIRPVLLSTACPTSLASDQTKGGGRPGVQRTPKSGAREQRFDLTKIQLSSKLSPKDPKEFAKKFRDATGEPREKRLLQITNLKATLQRLHRLYIYHTEKRSGRATPEIFLFFVCPLRGQFHSRRESSRRTSRLEGFC